MPMKRVLLMLVVGAAGAAEWTAPAQQALLGREPYMTLAEQGLPQPPMVAEVQALMPWVRARQAAAMKQVLFMRAAWTRANGRRVSATIESDCAGLARREEAPAALAEMYQAAAEVAESSPRAYARRRAEEALFTVYSVDEKAPGWLAEDLKLTPEDAEALLTFLPWEDMANMVSAQPPSAAMVTADLRTMRDCYRELAAAYAAVDSPEAAERAAETLLPTVRALLTTVPTQFLVLPSPGGLTEEQKALLGEAAEAFRLFREQSDRLSEKTWFDSLRLRALDMLAAG